MGIPTGIEAWGMRFGDFFWGGVLLVWSAGKSHHSKWSEWMTGGFARDFGESSVSWGFIDGLKLWDST